MPRLGKLKSLVRLYKTLYGKYKVQMAFLIFLGVLNGFLGSIGVVAIIPLFAFITHQQSAENNAVSIYVEKFFQYFNLEPSVKSLLIAIVIVFVAKAVVLSLFDYISGLLNSKISNEIRKEFYAKTLRSNWSYLVNQKIGYLDYALNEDTHTTISLLNKMYDAFVNLTSFLAYGATAFALSFYITFLAMAAGGLILFGTKYISGKIRAHVKRAGLLQRAMSHNLNETILALKYIKTMRVEGEAIQVLGDMLDKLKSIGLKMVKISALIVHTIEPITVIFVAVLFAVAYKQPGFNLASFFVTVYLIQQLFIYTQRFQVTIGLWNNSLPSVERIMALNDSLNASQEEDLGKNEFIFKNAIEFQGVAFSYASGTEVFKNLNFKIKKGETVGIVGPSGAGKTTISDLITRLLPQRSGKILIDGKNIEIFTLDSLRKNIGYVPQDIFLKDGTIEENIKFYDHSVSDKDVDSGARAANIYDFVKSLPGGFKTKVGDRGIFLSTGQRQRIVLARVLARRPGILILDEATSSLDGESERLIKQAIGALKGKVTVIIIAHRLSTVSDADKIIALCDGRIVEEGSPETLLQNPDSYFYKLYNISTA